MAEAVYPTSIAILPDVVDEVDDIEAEHMNRVRKEIIALQTYIGLNPHGSKIDLTERLAVMIGTDGALKKGSAFPTGAVDGQMFYRSDVDTPYIYDGTSWEAQLNLSNVIARWNGSHSGATGTGIEGFIRHSHGVPLAAGTSISQWLWSTGTASQTMYTFPWTKIGTVNTLTCTLVYIFGQGGTQTVALSVGSAIGSTVTGGTGVNQKSFTVDVSGEDAGTMYNLILWGRNTASGGGRDVQVFKVLIEGG